MKLKEREYEQDLKNALEILSKGGIILYPTDTIWGVGCDARNSEAVKRIFKLKRRDDSKSMLVLAGSKESIREIVDDIPDIAGQLIELSEEPLTIIYDGAKNIAKELIATDGSVGIRVTKEDFTRELCLRLGSVLVSTSANISGEKSPSIFKEISDEIKQGVDYIVKYRQNESESYKPSHIIKITEGGEFKILR